MPARPGSVRRPQGHEADGQRGVCLLQRDALDSMRRSTQAFYEAAYPVHIGEKWAHQRLPWTLRR